MSNFPEHGICPIGHMLSRNFKVQAAEKVQTRPPWLQQNSLLTHKYQVVKHYLTKQGHHFNR